MTQQPIDGIDDLDVFAVAGDAAVEGDGGFGKIEPNGLGKAKWKLIYRWEYGKMKKTFTVWTAQIIQHAIDHFNGILIRVSLGK